MFVENNEILYLKSNNLSFEKLLEISEENVDYIIYKLQDLKLLFFYFLFSNIIFFYFLFSNKK